ncbi:hypothetical protein [Streptomyces sp. NPDC048442]|uniref:hypothetical protein n=1 Tax=Streptomyces sp. NPDC048442 TaxID=3154823 RepID=UPI003435E2DF
MAEYGLRWTVEARQIHDALPAERQAMLDKGLRALLRNPYSKAGAAVGPYENDRKAMVAPGLLVEYAVLHGLVVVVAVDVLDAYLTTYLIDEAPEDED